MINNTINSPFRYAGGKFYARKLILEHIPAHTYYIEPLAGGASIFFAKLKVKYNQLNDLDEELINVYLTIRDKPEELIRFLTYRKNYLEDITNYVDVKPGLPLPADKKLHYFFKKIFTPKNNIERAGKWYYLNRTSYSGIMNYQNMYWGYGDKFSMQPKNWANNIKRASNKLNKVKLTNHDFEFVIKNAPNNAFLFIDPPYFNADQDKFYNCVFKKEDHYRLERCLYKNKNRLRFFITYDNCEEIKKMYSWISEIHYKEWNYCIQRTDDQINGTRKKGSRYKGKELFLLNYSSNNKIL